MEQKVKQMQKQVARNERIGRDIFFLAVASLLALAAVSVLSILFGSRQLSVAQISQVFLNTSDEINVLDVAIVNERIVRTIFSLVSGAALGVSGALMQAITRNPIADPSILGVNSGAALFVVMGIAFLGLTSAGAYIALALIGAAITAALVYGISSLGSGGATPIKLALAGTAVGASLTSLVTAVILPRGQVMDAFRFWQIGSVGAASWHSLGHIMPIIVTGLVIGVFAAPALNALALGDDVATGLGVKTGWLRVICAIAGVLLSGAVTAVAGPIGFIGLMAPHVMRLIIGPDQRLLIPMSAAAGAVILTAADIIGRILARPGELEVGVVTAFVGAPILVVVAIRSKMKVI